MMAFLLTKLNKLMKRSTSLYDYYDLRLTEKINGVAEFFYFLISPGLAGKKFIKKKGAL
jgi:hypothetical protein